MNEVLPGADYTYLKEVSPFLVEKNQDTLDYGAVGIRAKPDFNDESWIRRCMFEEIPLWMPCKSSTPDTSKPYPIY